jgi:DDE superfamily endonuclease
MDGAWDAFDDDDGLAFFHLILMVYGARMFTPENRHPSFFDQRLCWELYLEKHKRKNTLNVRLRMSNESFDRLLGYIRHELLVNETMAKQRGGAIIPELCLFCTLRWLAGGSHLDICDIVGISKSSFYRVVWKTIRAIVHAKALEIRFPETSSELEQAMIGFASISKREAIRNCVGVVDGYLLRIKVPSVKEVGNVKSFFSGHYQCYGVNVQAVTDHNSRFTFFSFASPGVTADRDAVRHCGLNALIEGLPFGACLIGDAAYEASEHMVPVFQGHARENKRNDNFNFYASQVRIRVEMAFGLLQAKWGILSRPIGCSIKNLKWLIQAVARLHNFVISERLAKNEGSEMVVPEDPSDTVPSYLPTIPKDRDGNIIDLHPLTSRAADAGTSELREYMADRVSNLGLERPLKNKRQRFN